MATNLITASFAAPDGTIITDYVSEVGGAWSQLLGFDVPFPATGVVTDYYIWGNTLRNNAGVSILVGAEGGQALPDNFTYDFTYALQSVAADHAFGLVFCASSGSPSFG